MVESKLSIRKFFNKKVISFSLMIIFGIFAIMAVRNQGDDFFTGRKFPSFELEEVEEVSSSGSSFTPNFDNLDVCGVNKLVNKTGPWSQCSYIVSTKAIENRCAGNLYNLIYYCLLVPMSYPYEWISALIFGLFAVVLIIFLFWLVWDTVKVHAAPLARRVAQEFGLSSGIAGATLFAIVNSSPTLGSVLAGVVTEDNTLVLSAPIGAAVFITGVALSCVILFAKVNKNDKKSGKDGDLNEVENKSSFSSKIKKFFGFFFEQISVPSKSAMYRDLIFCFVTVTIVFIFYLLRFITIYAAFVLLAIYIGYVLFISIGRCLYTHYYLPRKIERQKLAIEKQKFAQDMKNSKKPSGSKTPTHDEGNKTPNKEGSLISADPKLQEEVDKYFDKDTEEVEKDWTVKWYRNEDKSEKKEDKKEDKKEEKKESKGEYIGLKDIIKEDHFAPLPDDENNNNINQKDSDSVGIIEDNKNDRKRKMRNCCTSCWRSLGEHFEWKKKKWYSKIMYIILVGWTRLIRDLTMIRGEEDYWNKYQAAIGCGFGGFMVIALTSVKALSLFVPSNWIFLLSYFGGFAVVGLIVSIVIFFTTKSYKSPFIVYRHILYVESFIVSLCWVYLLSEGIVHMFSVMSRIVGIRPGFFGLTLLSWGNSIPDLLAHVRVATQGLPHLAIGACFGEPSLSLMLSLTLVFFYSSLKNLVRFGSACDWIGTDPALAVAFFALLIQIVGFAILLPIFRFKIRRVFAFFFLLVYILFLTLMIVAEFEPTYVGWFFSIIKIPVSVISICPLYGVSTK